MMESCWKGKQKGNTKWTLSPLRRPVRFGK